MFFEPEPVETPMRAAIVASVIAAAVALPPAARTEERTAGGVCLGTPEECAERRERDQAAIDDGLSLVINFAFDSAELGAEEKRKLAGFATVLRNNRLRSVEFYIDGHTDALGSASYNRELSRRRAEAVVAFLVESGIDPARLQPVGQGMSSPRTADPLDPVNRRVELRLRAE